jgi:CheY-like chemotaxis protein
MGGTILLADDSITIQKVVELTFAETDHRVVAVGSGRELFRRLPDVKPDLVLCDVVMPDMNGYDICQSLKSEPSTLHLPVILLTGTFEPFDRDRALAAGCDAIVTKPFEARDLISSVEDLLRRAGGAASPAPNTPMVGVPEGVPGIDFSSSGLDRKPPEQPLPVTEPDGGIELTASMRRDAYPASAPPPPPELLPVTPEAPADTFVFSEEPAPAVMTVPEWGPQIVAPLSPTAAAAPADAAAGAVMPLVITDEEFGFAEEPAPADAAWDTPPSPAVGDGSQPHGAEWRPESAPVPLDSVEAPAAHLHPAVPEAFLAEPAAPAWGDPPLGDMVEARTANEPTHEPVPVQNAPGAASPAAPTISEESLAERITERVLAALPAPVQGFSLENLGVEQARGLAGLIAPHLPATATAAAPQPEAAAISDLEVDRIARRTLELATPLLERIAWEIIPDMAEMLVRKRIAEIEHAAEQEG